MKLISRNRNRRRQMVAWTLLEMMVATAVLSISGAAVCTAYLFGLRSFQALSNYAQLDQKNREGMDRITKEIRQASTMRPSQTGAISFVAGNGAEITYRHDAVTRQVTRWSNGVNTGPILFDCDAPRYQMGRRFPTPTNELPYEETSAVNDAKILDLTWKTGRQLRGNLTNTESIQTAKIVLRRKAIAGIP
jgi:type II secretory pathway component PulJ